MSDDKDKQGKGLEKPLTASDIRNARLMMSRRSGKSQYYHKAFMDSIERAIKEMRLDNPLGRALKGK